MGVPQFGEVFYILSSDGEIALTAAERADGRAYARPIRELKHPPGIAFALWEVMPAPDSRYYIVDQRHRRALVSFDFTTATHRDLEEAIAESANASSWTQCRGAFHSSGQ